MPESDVPRTKLYDIEQAAEYLSVSDKTVRRLIDSGKVPARKIKNVWHVEKSALEPLRGRIGRRGPKPAEPIQAIPAQFFEKMEKAIEELSEKVSDMDRRLFLFSQEREARNTAEDTSGKDREIESLRVEKESLVAENERLAAENERLEESLRISDREMEQHRQNGSKESVSIKNKSDEIEELKATITSNQRGLSLLREELADHKEQIRQKETLIKDMKARILELEQEIADLKTMKKSGLLLGRRKI